MAGLIARAEARPASSMKRVGIMSDVHLECEPPRWAGTGWLKLERARQRLPGHPTRGPLIDGLRGVDLILLAGDIDLGAKGIAYADAVATYCDAPVACVMGNHEGYGGVDLDDVVRESRAAAEATSGRVAFLERAAAKLAGLSILGCTLWTDYALDGDVEAAMDAARYHLNDHRLIRRAGRPFWPEDARRLHAESLAWLRGAAAQTRAGRPDAPLVVLTHHAPVRLASPPQFEGGPLSPAFASDLEGEVDAISPSLWVFGHTHHDLDCRVGRTRVVSSQRGYVTEPKALRYRPKVLEL